MKLELQMHKCSRNKMCDGRSDFGLFFCKEFSNTKLKI